MAHDPSPTGTTFDTWITAVFVNNAYKTKRYGVKLDFKDPLAVLPTLKLLHETRTTFNHVNINNTLLWLNADILRGPLGVPAKFDPDRFIEECQRYFPDAVLSLGWTTSSPRAICSRCCHLSSRACSWFDSGILGQTYTRAMVDRMLKLCTRYNLQNVTFPVRCCYVKQSWDQLSRLLDFHPNYSLTIWTSKQDPPSDMNWIISHVPADRVFLDLN